MKLYDRIPSGNCHKIRLMLSFLNLEYETVLVDSANKQHKSPDYLKMNPRGQFPVLVDEDSIVYDSHAILVYLALKYYNLNWYSNNPYEVALIQEWLSFSANEIHNSLNLARLKYKFNANVDWDLAKQKSILVLGILDQHLDRRDWLELSKPTIADIACFPYVALANEGKIDTSQYKNIIKWINNIKKLPGYIGMEGIVEL